MISNKVSLDSLDFNPAVALNEVDKCAKYMELGHKEAMRLRLLGEELMGMMGSIMGDFVAEFWVEADENKSVELHIKAKGEVGDKKKNVLLGVSSTGKNAAARGVMGKIRLLVEECLYGDLDNPMEYVPMHYFTVSEFGAPSIWSLSDYVGEVSKKRDTEIENWDELEKSIIAKLADDVTVSARSHEAEITVKKAF